MGVDMYPFSAILLFTSIAYSSGVSTALNKLSSPALSNSSTSEAASDASWAMASICTAAASRSVADRKSLMLFAQSSVASWPMTVPAVPLPERFSVVAGLHPITKVNAVEMTISSMRLLFMRGLLPWQKGSIDMGCID